MDYTTLNLILISANGLKKSRLTCKRDVYAIVSISGTADKSQKLRTNIDKNGDSDPTWNFPMKFFINESAGLQNHLTLVVKIKAVGVFSSMNLGEIRIPIKNLLDDVKTDRKTMRNVSYQVRRVPSGKVQGVLNLSYEFGERFSGDTEVGSGSGNPESYVASGGYGFPNQQPGYGYYQTAPPVQWYGGYPPPQVVQPRRNRMSNSGMGFGTGLLGGALGGLLLGDIVSDAAPGGGCGGGCGGGGGGCGGGCGGGGCGGF